MDDWISSIRTSSRLPFEKFVLSNWKSSSGAADTNTLQIDTFPSFFPFALVFFGAMRRPRVLAMRDLRLLILCALFTKRRSRL